MAFRAVDFVAFERPTLGRVRQAIEHALHTPPLLPPSTQLGTPDIPTTGMAVLYGFDSSSQVVTLPHLDQLDPHRPVTLIGTRQDRTKRQRTFDEALKRPAFATRPILREEPLHGAALLHLGPAAQSPATTRGSASDRP